MMSIYLANLILNFLIVEIAPNPAYRVPLDVWTLMIWKAARLKPYSTSYIDGVTAENFRAKALESLKETLNEQVAARLEPLLTVTLPPGKSVYDLVELVQTGNDTQDLQSLCSGYNQLMNFGANCPFYNSAVEHLPLLLNL